MTAPAKAKSGTSKKILPEARLLDEDDDEAERHRCRLG
jgi:hypothetical protein